MKKSARVASQREDAAGRTVASREERVDERSDA